MQLTPGHVLPFAVRRARQGAGPPRRRAL